MHIFLTDEVAKSCRRICRVALIFRDLSCAKGRITKNMNLSGGFLCSYAVSVPNGPDYQFGDPNRSKLRPYRQSTVRPAPEPVRTVMNRSGLVVQASSITCRFYSPLILRLPQNLI